jgi:hypothetical protein
MGNPITFDDPEVDLPLGGIKRRYGMQSLRIKHA